MQYSTSQRTLIFGYIQVATLLILETFNTVLIVIFIYESIIINFGQLSLSAPLICTLPTEADAVQGISKTWCPWIGVSSLRFQASFYYLIATVIVTGMTAFALALLKYIKDDAQSKAPLSTVSWLPEIRRTRLRLSTVKGIIALLVQLFYAWRILVLTRNWIIVSIIILLSLAETGMSHLQGSARVVQTKNVKLVLL